MYLAWRYGGSDPFKLYHGLDDFYRRPGTNEMLTPGTDRGRWLVYGFAEYAESEEMQKLKAKG